MSGDVDLDALDAKLKEAYRAMSLRLAEEMFPPFIGPPPPPPPWHERARRRVSAWWLGVREWIAEKVLRVDLYQGGDEKAAEARTEH